MPDHDASTAPTTEQGEAIAAPSPLFIDACPGAGKTHVLSLRHLATPEGRQRRGRALISFTNRAADEIRARCQRPELLGFPHFIGTLDAFLHQYLVRPFLPPGSPIWQRVISWSDLGPGGNLQVFGRVDLAKFAFGYDTATGKSTVRLPDGARLLTNAQRSKEAYLAAALAMRDKLWHTQHLMTGLELRIMALQNAGNPELTAVLRERFAEIVVDEAQDCTELDTAILTRLHHAGIPLVIVADPQQAIYEYEGAIPAVLATLTDAIANHLPLTGNHRCSQSICDVAATMRPARARTPDVAVGPWRGDQTPLLLLPFANQAKDKAKTGVHSVRQAAAAFTRYASSLDPACADVLCLAWKHEAVPRIDARGASRQPGSAPAWRLAWAAQTYKDSTADHSRLLDATNAAAVILARYWYPEESGSVERILTGHAISPAIVRRYAAALLDRLPAVDDRAAGDWIAEARKLIIDHPAPADAAAVEARRYRLSTGGKSFDRAVTIAQAAGLDTPGCTEERSGPDLAVTSTTIHKAKGGEADAVLIAVPKPDDVRELLTQWANSDTDSSAVLRVYYVALTRTRRLAALTYPYTCHTEVTKHLDDLGVNYRLAPECAPNGPRDRRRSKTPTRDLGMDAIPGLI